MRNSLSARGVFGLILLASSSTTAQAQIQGLQRVASGLSAPIAITHAPGQPNQLYIAQRSGAVRILDLTTGIVQTDPFITIPGVDTEGEGGLLGLAFHPNFASNGKFYVNLTSETGAAPFSTHVREYTRNAINPSLADVSSQREILSFAQPQSNHNGGWIGFSPTDSNLYIATGDGGGGNDDDAGHTDGIGNAQDTTNNLLGKMLRINVNADDFLADSTRNYAIPANNPFKAGVGDPADDAGDDEIWSYGLRNPFRASFDRANGDLWIGDVGQSAREEIDHQPNGAGGANFGWRLREGRIANPTVGVGGTAPAGAIDPVYDYDRDADAFGGSVVTGGYVYRGPDPTLQGKYFFLDSRNTSSTGDDNYWMFDPADPFGTVTNIDALLLPDVRSAEFPVSFGEDALGNLYIAYLASGEVYRIQTAVVPEPAVTMIGLFTATFLLARRRRE
jgi:glucose/arabinose dehydrogenase